MSNLHEQLSPGDQPYTPTRIEWLTTFLQASLRRSLTDEGKFLLSFIADDAETVLIQVRYLPDVNRELMNRTIDVTRKQIQVLASGYKGETWVKIKEDVQMLS